jgi:hypothetical protein
VLASTAPASPAFADDDDDTQPEPPPRKRLYAVQLDPLAWFIGRFGVDFEALVASHHALTATLHGDYIAAGNGFFNWGGDTTSYSGFGGELGWHVYVLPGELRGYWFGPSFVFGAYQQSTSGATPVSFSQVGLALDMGARIGRNGLTFDIGGGVQVAHLSNPDQWGPQLKLMNAQVRPRVLMGLGYSF